MEKREPSLAPEWLRSPRHGSNQLLSSSFRSGSASSSKHNKTKISRRTSDVDSVRSPFLNRPSSTNTWRASSNGFTKNTYTRGHEQLRRSYSVTTNKHGNHLTQDSGNINFYNMKGGTLPPRSPANISRRTGFEKGIPLFKAEESNGGPSVVRIPSPGPCLAAQSLPVGKSTLFTGEGWTSALAEVPNIIKKTSVKSHDNVGNSPTLMGRTARNMAQALVQTPSMGEINTQRVEDRAIKQSKQLRPVVPSAPKGSAKAMVRSGETDLASSRNTLQQSSMVLGNLRSNPGFQIKPATTKKLVVLKPSRENGVSTINKFGSPTGPSQLATAPSTQVMTSMTSANSPRELKGASINKIAGRIVEKKPFLGQSQSRNAFYKALKEGSSTNISSDPSKTSSTILCAVEEKTNTLKDFPASDSWSRQSTKRDEIMKRVEKIYEDRKKNNGFISVARPRKIEGMFLRSLGWDENSSEDGEPLTLGEIKTFLTQTQRRNTFCRTLKQDSSTNIANDPSKTSSSIDSSIHSTKRDEIMKKIEKIVEVKTMNNGFISVARPRKIEGMFLRSLEVE